MSGNLASDTGRPARPGQIGRLLQAAACIRRPDVRDNMLLGAAVAVGALASFKGFASMTDGGAIKLAIALLFTLLLHALVIHFAHAAALARGWSARILWLVGWAASAAVSVLLGYAFFFTAFSSSFHAGESATAALDRLLRDATMVSSAYEEIARSAGDLAGHSRVTARRELETGGTCADGNMAADNGPRRRFRIRSAEMFANANGHFSGRARDLRQVVKTAEAAVAVYEVARHAETVALVRRAYAEASAFSRDPRLQQWRQQLVQAEREIAGPIEDPLSGARFFCQDPALAAKLAAAGSVTTVPAITADAPAIEGPGHDASVRRGFALISGTANFDVGKDGTAFLFGGIVDLAILIIVFSKVGRQRLAAAAGGGDGAPADPRNGPSSRLAATLRLPAAFRGDAVTKLRLGLAGQNHLIDRLLPFLLFDARNAILVVPVDGSDIRREEIGRLALLLHAARLATPLPVRPATATIRGWEEDLRGLALGDATRIRIYRLRPGTLEDLVLDSWRALFEEAPGREDGDERQRRPVGPDRASSISNHGRAVGEAAGTPGSFMPEPLQ